MLVRELPFQFVHIWIQFWKVLEMHMQLVSMHLQEQFQAHYQFLTPCPNQTLLKLVGDEIFSFTFRNASTWLAVQIHAFFGLNNCRKGCDTSAKCGENLFSWLIIPINLLNLVMEDGEFIFRTASVFLGSGVMSLLSIRS